MSRKIQLFGGIILISTCLVFARSLFRVGEQERTPDGSRRNMQIASNRDEGKSSGAPIGNSWGMSPFSGTANAETLAAEVAATRYEKMKRLGYETPAKYYQMSLTQLKELAKNGDVQAMVQLAEQYHSEHDYIKNDPGFDRSRPSGEIATQNLENAVRAGYTRAASAAVIQMVEDNNLIDAYAWHLLSQRLNDHPNDKLYETEATFAKLSAMDKAEARGKFDELQQRLISESY